MAHEENRGTPPAETTTSLNKLTESEFNRGSQFMPTDFAPGVDPQLVGLDFDVVEPAAAPPVSLSPGELQAQHQPASQPEE